MILPHGEIAIGWFLEMPFEGNSRSLLHQACGVPCGRPKHPLRHITLIMSQTLPQFWNGNYILPPLVLLYCFQYVTESVRIHIERLWMYAKRWPGSLYLISNECIGSVLRGACIIYHDRFLARWHTEICFVRDAYLLAVFETMIKMMWSRCGLCDILSRKPRRL